MLTYKQEIELIRQAEKANMTADEEATLKKWALQTRLNNVILELIFDGCVDVDTIVNEPSLSLTPKGAMIAGTEDINEVIEEILSADPDDYDDYDDDDYEDYDEDEHDEECELDTVMTLGKSVEEIQTKVKVLKTLCKQLGIECQ